MISLVVAVSRNNVIGRNGQLPWRLSADLKHFKALTMGKPVVMGRLTWESIGRPLPGRQNIVVTRQADYVAEGCRVVASPVDAIDAAASATELMVIGGSHIYAAFLPLASRIYLTRVHADVEGDALFPGLDANEWQASSGEEHPADDTNEFGFTFLTLERIDTA